jgi:MFS family permease
LGCLILLQVSNQWQRYLISTSYDFYSTDPANKIYDNPKYEIQAAINNFTAVKYGYIAGPFFGIIFGFFCLWSGFLADKISRKHLYGIAGICWSLTSIGMALSQTFASICLCRMFLGVFESFNNPCAFSLIADYFPQESRTTANSLFCGAVYFGIAFA